MDSDRRPPGLSGLLIGVCLGALLVTVAIVRESDWQQLHRDPATYLLLSLLIVAGELLPVVVPDADRRGEVTVSTTFALALALVGPLGLAVLVQAVAVSVQDLRSHRALVKLAYNMSQYVLALAAARAAYVAITGGAFTWGRPLQVPGDLPGVLLAATVFFVVNGLLVGLVSALAGRTPIGPLLLRQAPSALGTYGVLLAFVPVIAVAENDSMWLVPLLLLPVGVISANARLTARGEHEAMHDALTQLPNRVLFQRRARCELAEAAAEGRPAAVMLLDLDHFREINDTLGHQFGDDLLAQVGQRLRGSSEQGDWVARLGGDEFAVLTGPADPPDAAGLGHRLLERLEQPFCVDGVKLDVHASIGVAVFPEHGRDVDTLLQRADVALYEAKVERSTVRVYEPVSDVHTPQRLALATELRDGLGRGELFLEFQPKVLGASGAVCGFEALVRWRHPSRGVLMPDEFLPVVENTDLIVPLTLAVLTQGLDALVSWRAAGYAVTVAVNLSVRHLADRHLPGQVARLLAERELPPATLVLEVTETTVMSDPARAIEVLASLRALGLSVSVDDYGTGYSSLSYLQRLDVDELKIDKSFVVNLASDPGDSVIVRSTVELGHSLGLHIVAEGVEDEGALLLLRDWGCDVLQGYHISRPLALDRVLPWLSARPAPHTRSGG